MAPKAPDREGANRFSSVKLGYLRHIVQSLVLVLLLYSLASYSFPIALLWRLDPLLAFSAALSGAVLPIPFLVLAVAMLLASVALGRAFCGWICPLGFVQDLTSHGRRKNWMPEGLRYVKYALLLGGLLLPIFAGWSFLEWITPISVLPRGLSPIWGPYDQALLAAFVLLFILVFSAVTEKRAWCRYACPLGALLSLPSAIKAVGIEIDQEKCIRCKRCERVCTMGIIDIDRQGGLRWDSECIACLACRDICPVDAIGLTLRS